MLDATPEMGMHTHKCLQRIPNIYDHNTVRKNGSLLLDI